ncbi:hypothetical protein QFC21_000626 [Naganishia friedmannii]|uniref:Uncharacterized protein n=1 Tax=Naganishia friedmannii TaxID=89922 RepID=A0ACC2WCC4_9TREE|nr:hypothetical protein QFC21_000626 [Naganishia friedmannii]
MVKVSSLALAGVQVSYAFAAPYFADPQQTVFDTPPTSRIDKINPLKHLSAISPFFIPTEEPTPLPNPTCNITTASFLIRHSSIMGNDDEFEMTMQPFIWKVGNFSDDVFPSKDELAQARMRMRGGEDEDVGVDKWQFLRDWKTPVEEETLEKLSKRGSDDAEYLGKYLRKQLGYLFPPPWKGKNSHKHHHEDADGKHKKKLFGRNVKDDGGDDDGKAPHHHHHDKDGHDVPEKNPKHKEPGPPYKIWTASSARDIDSAQAFIKGAFPDHQAGKEGNGDGVNVQLVKVPNRKKDWEQSLTPHKACDTFEKESSLPPAAKWLKIYAPRIRQRLAHVVPRIADKLEDMDVLAMMELCGYETIIQGDSGFCNVFTDDEWLDGEWYFDVRFHYMMGYGNELSPFLGAPWVKTARHLLAGDVDDQKPHDKDGENKDGNTDLWADWVDEVVEESDELMQAFVEDVVDDGWGLFKRDPHHKGKKHSDKKHKGDKKKHGKKHGKKNKGKKPKEGDKLPEPKLPPNGTHTQLLHAFFTHRESPAFVATFLNLYNDTVNGMPAASVPPVLDMRPEPRQWRTSELVPFLGHIALERFSCGIQDPASDLVAAGEKDTSNDYVRAMVNGKFERMIGCDDGLGKACRWETFEKWVDARLEIWGEQWWDEVCTKKDD